MKKLLFILLLASSFASAQKVNGYISFMYSLGVPSDTIALPPSEKSNPHFAVKGNDSYIWSVPQQKWIILVAGGNTYTNGNGLLLSGNIFKADTFSIATRVRVLKEIDSVKNLMVYTNGFGIAPIVSNVIRADTFNIATRPYVKKVADSIKANIGIPTLQQVISAGASLTSNNTVIQTSQSLSFNGGLYHFQSLSFAGQGFLDIAPNATTISSVLVGASQTSTASVATKSDEVYPYVQIQAGTNGTGYGSLLRFTRDSIFFAPLLGIMGIDSLAEYTDSAINLPMTWNTTSHRWGHLNRWPGAVGGGGGGGGPDVFLGNVLKTSFDTLLYFPSWNNSIILAKGVQLTAGSSKLSLVKTVTDSTLAWEADVVPGNISLSALGGSLNISQINATGTASSSTYLRGDGTWSAAGGGGGLSGMTAGRIQVASSSSALVDYSNLTWDNTNKRIVLTGADADWNGKAGIEMVNTTGDKHLYLFTSNYDFRITSNFFGTNGIISMNGQGDDVKFSNAYPGAMIFAPNTVEQFRLAVDGKAIFQTLKSGSTAPTTSGTTKMVVTDANGLLSFADIPSGGGSGEVNTASNLGGGLANFSAKSGVDLQFNSFTASDFNLASNLISIDYTNGQAASASNKGFLTSTDWSTFNGKAAATGGSGYVQNQFSSAQSGSSGSMASQGSTMNY
jgi:hypothetical protein